MATVMTVRDFTQIFDAYAQFEESLVSRRMVRSAQLPRASPATAPRPDSAAPRPAPQRSRATQEAVAKSGQENDVQLELLLARLENLMDRRPFLVNDVLLRQNPNSVHEWQKRVSLWGDNKEKVRRATVARRRGLGRARGRRSQGGPLPPSHPAARLGGAQVVETYSKAVTTIDPRKAAGSLPQLWTQFAQVYSKAGDIESARAVFERAVKVPFRQVDDLAQVWCDYAEMEIEAGYAPPPRARRSTGSRCAPPGAGRSIHRAPRCLLPL